VLGRSLADDLGLKPSDESITDEDGQRYFPIRLPEVRLGSFPLDFGSIRAFMRASGNLDFRDSVDGFLPGGAFKKYQVIIDYPRKLFTIGHAGSIRHEGQALRCPFLPDQGHPRVEVVIDGTAYGFLLDTGAKVTLVGRDLMQSWAARHSDWPRSSAAVGPANMTGHDNERDAFMLRIPELDWTIFKLRDVAIVSRPSAVYEQSSQEMTAPIVGALAGNVLSSFRIEIDYPQQMAYLKKSGKPDPHDMDTVGVVLSVNDSGDLVVKGISPRASSLTRENLHPGDVLVRIDGANPSPRTLTAAAQALSGTPGEIKHLLVRRNGIQFTTTVTVAHIL
jgi:hypothetical protein